MAKINLLPTNIAELIAAGEVIERPASVVKEMIENSIDAGATRITVEIQHGGIIYIRIADNGCGIEQADVPTAFLRHATSKIKVASDLDAISTLGFRGEALAAAASVSKIEMFTKTAEADSGTHYKIEGGKEIFFEETGCPQGTTIIVRDLFYNTPARMKFLKKDVSEGNAVAAVVDRAALSHPEISFKLIRDGKQTLSTSGDGKLESAIYSVLGRDFSRSLIPVSSDDFVIRVSGFICKPVFCRQSRSAQYIFLNNRLVHSGTVTAAVEQAYKNSAMVGKFPGFVLNVGLPFDMVDVNVHPAKTEVRFSDERKIFEAVHYAVKNALLKGDTRPEIAVNPPKQKPFFEQMSAQEYRQQAVNIPKTSVEKIYEEQLNSSRNRFNDEAIPYFLRKDVKAYVSQTASEAPVIKETKKADVNISVSERQNPEALFTEKTKSADDSLFVTEEPEIKYIGQAFLTYIVVETENSIFLIDKHAAHERIIFNRLKSTEAPQSQQLLYPITVRLGREEYDAVIENLDLLLEAGIEADDFGNGTVAVRAVPVTLTVEDAAAIITEAAESLKTSGTVANERLDQIYHTVACKAAIKAGSKNSSEELTALAKTVLSSKDIMYCPHGRPVAFELKRRDLEKQFGRIQ